MTRIVLEVLANENLQPLVSPLALPAVVPNYFMANWQTAIEIEESWSTDVAPSADAGAEERRSLVDRPYRTMAVQLTALTRSEVHRLWMNITRLADARGPMPLYSDHARVTGAVAGDIIPCDTTYRRFFKGARIAIHTWASNRPASVQYYLILEVKPTYIRTTTTITGSFGSGDRVIPMIDVEIALETSGLHVTREKTNLVLRVNEVVGQSALPPLVNIANVVGTQFFEDDPIFVTRPDWSTGVQSGVVRVGRSYGLGRGQIVFTEGERPQQRHELAIVNPTRAALWEVKRHVDSRRGRGRPQWLLNPSNLYELVAITSTYADITAEGNIEDMEDFIEAIGFEQRDGTVTIARIATITDNTTTWRVNFETALASVPSSVWRCSSAHHVRLSNDGIREQWQNDEVSQVSVSFIDLLAEEAVEFDTDDGEIDVETEIDLIDNLYAWFAMHKNAYNIDDHLCAAEPISSDTDEFHIYTLRDVRDTLNPDGIQLRAYVNSNCRFAQFTNRKLNKGFGMMHHSTQAAFKLINSPGPVPAAGAGESLFGYDNLGFTMFVQLVTGSTVPAFGLNRWLMQISSAASAELLTWRLNSIRIFDVAGTVDSSLHITPVTAGLTTSKPSTFALRIEPSVSSILYVDGAVNASATNPVITLPTDDIILPADGGSFSSSNYFLGLAPDSADAEIDEKYGVKWFMNEMLMFQRALTTSEMNTVGQYLAAKYGSTWTDIP